jgi:uncharacterized protein YegP (UPF0339 family)
LVTIKTNTMDATYQVEFYSRKRMFKERQYYWRIRHWNGNIVADSGEGYFNKKDRDDSFYRIKKAMMTSDYIVKEL